MAEYYLACEEAKRKAFEILVPGHTLVAYREKERRIGHNNEYEVLYQISDDEHCIRVCLTEEYGDADFKEWEV